MLFVWPTGPRSEPVSTIGWHIAVLVAGMVGKQKGMDNIWQYMAERLQSGNDDWSGLGGQPPGSVIHLDPQTLVVVNCPPSPARGRRHGPCPQRPLETACGLRMNKHIHPWAGNRLIGLCALQSVSLRLNYRLDRPPEGAVKASAIAIDVTSEPVGGAVTTGAVGGTKDTGKRCLRVDRGRRGRSYIHTKWSCLALLRVSPSVWHPRPI